MMACVPLKRGMWSRRTSSAKEMCQTIFSCRALSNLAGPLIAFDGFQPIYDVFSNENRGELKVLLALGTQAQVRKLSSVFNFKTGRLAQWLNASLLVRSN